MSLASGKPNSSGLASTPEMLEVNSAIEDLKPLLKLLIDLQCPMDLIVSEMRRVHQLNPTYLNSYVVPYSGMVLIFYVVQRLCKATNDVQKAERECLSLLDIIINEFEANPDSLDGVMKQTVLFYAAKAGSVAVCKFLVSQSGANGSPVDIHQQTPLYYAAREGKLDTMEWLVKEGGCNVNHIDKNGQSALFYAARENRFDCVRKLVDELGADPLVRDVYKKRVRGYLKAGVHKETYEYLTEVERARDPGVAQHANRRLFLVKPGEPMGAAAMTLRQHKPYNPYEQEEAITASQLLPPPKRQRSGNSTPASSLSRESAAPRERLSLATPPPVTPTSTVAPVAGRNRYRVRAPLGKGGLEEFEKQFPDIAVWNKGRDSNTGDGASPPPKPVVSRAPRAPIASLTPPWVSVVSQLLRGPLWRYGPATIFHKTLFQLPPNLGPKYATVPGEPEKKLTIDLSLIRKKLEKGKYLRLTEVDRDVRSMFQQGMQLSEGAETPLGLLTKATEVYYEQQMAGSGLAAVLRQEASGASESATQRPDEPMVIVSSENQV